MYTKQELAGKHTYFRGDKAKFTGKRMAVYSGGITYKVKFTEGHKKGNFAWVTLEGPGKCYIHGPQTIIKKGQ